MKKEPLKSKFTDVELRARLDDEQFEVTQNGATERAFTGKHNENKADGKYKCVVCTEELFDSETKYDSGSGWPSFTAPAKDDVIEEKVDKKLFMTRTEVLCNSCGAHLGHVFPDGPGKGTQRYCVNSAALDFEER